MRTFSKRLLQRRAFKGVKPLPMLARASSSWAGVEDARKALNAVITKTGMDEATAAGLNRSQLNDLAAQNAEVRKALDSVKLELHKAFVSQPGPAFESEAPPVRIAVTGAAGAIGYSLLPRLASGQLLGPYQRIQLSLLEIPQSMKALEGVAMELQDCAFPLVDSVEIGSDPVAAFKDVEYAFLVGAKPRGPGMERADLLAGNAAIFKVQGDALNRAANRRKLKTVVVGNPANTNAWVASQFAPDISPTQFSAMTRLDHNRGLGLLSQKTGVPVNQIERFAVWGNHSKTQYPDISHTLINGKWAPDVVGDQKWVRDTFIPTVQDRGAAIIAARGASSAASAASSALDHMRDWALGNNGQWTSMAVWSEGNYGAEPGIFYSFPVTCLNDGWCIVENIPIDKFSAAKMEASNKELIAERDEVAKLVGIKVPAITDHFAQWKARYDKEGVLPASYPPVPFVAK